MPARADDDRSARGAHQWPDRGHRKVPVRAAAAPGRGDQRGVDRAADRRPSLPRAVGRSRIRFGQRRSSAFPQLRVRLRRDARRLLLRRLHALDRRAAARAGRAGPVGRRAVRGLRREDRRDAAGLRAGPDVRGRALRVRSWSGTNLLGGGDGATLADAGAAASKTSRSGAAWSGCSGRRSEGRHAHRQRARPQASGRRPGTTSGSAGSSVSRMKMQFTWQGCDSALAAPLVLDLARLLARAHEAGRPGRSTRRAFFFKDPVPAIPGEAVEYRLAEPIRSPGRLGPVSLSVSRPLMVDVKALMELVRAPAAFSVPGDVLAGAAAAGRPIGVRTCWYGGGLGVPVLGRHGAQRSRRPVRGRVRAPRAAVAFRPDTSEDRAGDRGRSDGGRARYRGRGPGECGRWRWPCRWRPPCGDTTSRGRTDRPVRLRWRLPEAWMFCSVRVSGLCGPRRRQRLWSAFTRWP